ncbi:hypothetical protein [Legionella sp. km772]|uniref:hypothetical protein n=1 Tax=Legionella sp. km772 TaxID=2498111 RepID=UPI000F8DD7FD|nr:hypothetical protein [Legionella sp. km772]RUR13573.1 hypothetical protein ELY15_01825 [Legionella sp. km772]
MDRSKFLSKVIGFYLIIVSSVMLANMPSFYHHINEVVSNSSLMFVTGFFTLMLGLLMVVAHNIWEWNWRLIITLTAWLVVLKALNLIIFPDALDQVTKLFLNNNSLAYGIASLDFVLGIVLVYFGFRR